MLSIKYCNNKTSDIKLVYLYSIIKMMQGPINVRSWGMLTTRVSCTIQHVWRTQRLDALQTQISNTRERGENKKHIQSQQTGEKHKKQNKNGGQTLERTIEDATKRVHWNLAAWHERGGLEGYSLLLMPLAFPLAWKGATWENYPPGLTWWWLSKSL